MSFVIAGKHLRRYNYQYNYNTRATPGQSQLVYYIKESLFNYIYIYIYYIKESLFNYIYIYIYMCVCVCVCVSGEVTREPGYVAKIFYTRS